MVKELIIAEGRSILILFAIFLSKTIEVRIAQIADINAVMYLSFREAAWISEYSIIVGNGY